MALVVTFRVPKDLLAKHVPGYGTPVVDIAVLKQAVRLLIDTHLDSPYPAQAYPVLASMQTDRINISFPEDSAQRIRALAVEKGIPESEICQQIAIAALNTEGLSSEQPFPKGAELLAQACDHLGFDKLTTQAAVFLNLVSTLSNGSVGLVEAGTGTGKTLAILVAAESKLREIDDSRVLIATPTVALVLQMIKAHHHLAEKGFDIHGIRPIFGRREFVSKETLLEIAEHANYIDHREAIMAWIKRDGAPEEGSPLAAKWLTCTLSQVAPGFPAELCAIDNGADTDDPGWISYLNQFKHASHDDKEIVVCTHAMLGFSTRNRIFAASHNGGVRTFKDMEKEIFAKFKDEDDPQARQDLAKLIGDIQAERLLLTGVLTHDTARLPPFRYLIIDEAHQLESAFAGANAQYLSLNSLLGLLQTADSLGVGPSKANQKVVRDLILKIKECGSLTTEANLDIVRGAGAAVRVRECLEAMHAALMPKARSKSTSSAQIKVLQRIEFARNALKNALKIDSNSKSEMRFSPVREFPQLFSGAQSVAHILAFLWSSVKASACVSATLYLPKQDGFSGAFQAGILNIPRHRLAEFPPVSPSWLYTTVRGLWLPKQMDDPLIPGRFILRPPTRSDRLPDDKKAIAESLWLDDVARLLESVDKTAAGGLMVLMTSYDSCASLASRLPQEMSGRLVVARASDRLSDQSVKFLKLSHKGLRPIWIATGGAWTGLDIGGHKPWEDLFGVSIPAGEDNVLTDLIIPRFPYGLNKSLTHANRIATTPAIPWDMLDAIFRLKQGIGRPVRRRGLPANRRIFLSDARIHDLKFAGIQQKIREICKPYSVFEWSFE